MNKKATVAALIVIVAIGIFAITNKEQDSNETQNSSTTEESTKTDDAMMQDGSQIRGDSMNEGSTNLSPGTYKDYSPALVASEQAAGRKVVLFFHATWCPDCRAADAEFKSHQELIPAGVTLLKVDYDSNTDLKKKYGVTYQHTFVQIDDNGNQITKWVSGRVDLLAQNIK